MSHEALKPAIRACALACIGAIASSCSSGAQSGTSQPTTTAGAPSPGSGSPGTAATGGSSASPPPVSTGLPGGRSAQTPVTAQAGQAGSAPASTGEFGQGGKGTAGQPAAGSGGPTAQPAAGSGGPPGAVVEAKCGPNDKPEKGLQGDVNQGTVNCGLTLLADIPGGGHVQGSGHCAFVRGSSQAAYGAGTIKAYSLADPLNPKQTDMEPGVGGSESMRGQTVEGRAILVSGSGVYDVSNCEDIKKKGEIKWPSENAMNGLYFAALSSHEIAISHDAKRVYSGLGFAVAHIEVGSSRVDLQACKLEYSIVSPK